MEAPYGDGHYTNGEAANAHRRAAVSGSPVPKPTIGVLSPALDGARRGQDAAMGAPNGDDCNTAAEPAHGHRRATVRGRPIPKLTVGILPPALEAAACGHGAGVGAAHGEGNGRRGNGMIGRRHERRSHYEGEE